MALIKFTECGYEVPDKASACPNCCYLVKRILALLFLLTLFLPSFAYDFEVDGIYYNKIVNNKVEVTYKSKNDRGYSGDVVIPDVVEYNGTSFQVTFIGDNAFSGCRGLTSVTIGNGVTSIGENAFSGSGLTSVTIGNSVTSIGEDAFYDCCLTSLIFHCKHIGRWFVDYDDKTYINTIVIGNGVETIGNSAFSGFTGLTSVTIGNSVTSIDNYSFKDCTSLTSVTIPNSVISIGYGVFYGCSGLTSLTISNSATSIGGAAFYGCSGLTSVTVPNSVTSIGNYAFRGCTGLKSMTIPNSVTSIGEGAFDGCTGLTSVTFGNSVTSIGERAFDGCTGLTSLSFHCISIGNWFNYNYKKNITNITIGEEVEEIGSSAFSGFTGLTSVTIPNSITSIGERAFSGCSNLRLKSLAVKPPTLEGDLGITSIEVPVGSACNYAMEENWNNLIETIYSVQNNVRLYPVPLYVNGESIVSVNGVSELGVEVEEGQAVKIAKTNSFTSYGLVMQYDTYITDILLDNGNYTFKASSHHKENKIETFAYQTQVVHVSESGTLLNQIGIQNIDNVYSLKVSGNLNGTDILAIRKMTNLKLLDMEDANIVDGGTSYYQDYVTSNNAIGDYFFKEKENLGRIILPKTITDIKSYAFDGCKNMVAITIPNSVTSIGDAAFNGCSGLTSVHISDLEAWCGISFDSNPLSIAHHLYFNGEEIKDLVIPNSVTSINQYAFSGCSGLTSVTIPNSVTSIGYGVFYGCNGLTSVTIGNSVTSISQYAFSGCSGLTSVTIPNSVTSIGNKVFSGCSGLISVTIGNSVTSIGSLAFEGCSNLTTLTILDGTETLKFSTTSNSTPFSDCPLECLYLGRNLEYRYDMNSYRSPFIGKNKLTSLTIGNFVTSIGRSAFYGCSGLTSVTIPNSVTSIGSSAFRGCSGLTSVTIPNSVTSIGELAFYGCSGLTSVTIGNSVTSIGYEAFYGCSGLTSVTIGNSVTSIGSSAFYNCNGLTSVTLLCKEVGSWFKGMTSIKELIFGEDVTFIGDAAFNGCSGLTSVHIFDLEAWCNMQFSDSNSNPLYYAHHLYLNGEEIKDLVIPNDVTSIGQSAFEGCSGLTSVTIPNSVTSIGGDAFKGCSGLTSVTSLNTTPPEIQSKTFSEGTYSTATLKVPVGCQTIYWLHPYWENFTNVEEVASTITVTAKNCSREYGEENPVFGYDVLGGELEGTPEIICEATKNSPVGTYPIVIRNGSVTNDDVAYVDGTLTITKAPLTITAKSYTINRNDALPVYEATYSGFKNGETNSVLTKQPTLSCTATNSETAGEYVITPSGAAATNYTISYVAGKLTINADASQTITMATSSGSPRTMKGYSSPYGLDFTNVDGVKAYTAVGFSKDHVVYLSRVKIVPPNTGVILRTETPGITVDVPITDDDVYLANLLLPAVSNVIVNPTEVLDGVEYRNLMVGQLNGTTTMGFVEFSSPVTRSNNCYLHIPSSFYNSTATARALGGLEVEFDEGEFTDIREIEEKKTIGDDKVYDLQGRKVNAPSKGIVIKNGKLVFIK